MLCEDTLPDGNFTKVMTLVERFAAGTPLIVVSRRDEWENCIAALAAGAADYLAFPPYPGEVEQSLDKAARLNRTLAHAA